MKSRPATCDIFCNVIDNFGDIGVCWRLSLQLANEHGLLVRLWVDDLKSLSMMCHAADAAHDSQNCRGVEVRRWVEPFLEVQPADLVIEAFACKLPQNYLEAMRQQSVWINLEYLSAEGWIEGCHKLPSHHPRLPLVKYFFFPGFTKKSGGLLLERDLLVRRDAFQRNKAQQLAYWHSLGLEIPGDDTLKISLFGYENSMLTELFDVWAHGANPVLCLVPEGRILPQVYEYFNDSGSFTCGNLKVHVLPFVEQERYDELLWACDVNFVRGEDSFVRAQWAARPFIWQIYPQHDAVHFEKLQAFLNLYCATFSSAAREAMEGMWKAWNSGQSSVTSMKKAWQNFAATHSELDFRAQEWAQDLAENNLALNLLDFCEKIGRIHAFEIEEQQ